MLGAVTFLSFHSKITRMRCASFLGAVCICVVHLLFSGRASIISGKQPPFEATGAQWSESHKLGISMVKFSLSFQQSRGIERFDRHISFSRAAMFKFLCHISHSRARCRDFWTKGRWSHTNMLLAGESERELCSALLSAWAINYAKNTISASAPFSQINLSRVHIYIQPFARGVLLLRAAGAWKLLSSEIRAR